MAARSKLRAAPRRKSWNMRPGKPAAAKSAASEGRSACARGIAPIAQVRRILRAHAVPSLLGSRAPWRSSLRAARAKRLAAKSKVRDERCRARKSGTRVEIIQKLGPRDVFEPIPFQLRKESTTVPRDARHALLLALGPETQHQPVLIYSFDRVAHGMRLVLERNRVLAANEIELLPAFQGVRIVRRKPYPLLLAAN